MNDSIFDFLKNQRGFRLWLAAGLLSQIGSGFSQIAVYSELARLGSGTSGLSAAFGLSLIPGLFSAQLGKYLLGRLSPYRLLLITETFGALGCLLPLVGSQNGNLSLLMATQFLTSLWVGLSIPGMTALIADRFEEEDLASVTKLQSLVFTGQVVFGQTLGALLYGRIPTPLYFLLDSMSFILSAGLIWLGVTRDSSLAALVKEGSDETRQIFRWGRLSLLQKQAVLTLPVLAFFGAPALALLPGIALNYKQNFPWLGLFAAVVPAFLLAKTLGQMMGPLLMPKKQLQKLATQPLRSFDLILVYLLLYFVIASFSLSVGLALLLTLVAHVLSNQIYAVGSYSIPRKFSGIAAGHAAAFSYQLQLTIMVVQSVVVSVLSQFFSPAWILGILLALSLVFRGCIAKGTRP